MFFPSKTDMILVQNNSKLSVNRQPGLFRNGVGKIDTEHLSTMIISISSPFFLVLHFTLIIFVSSETEIDSCDVSMGMDYSKVRSEADLSEDSIIEWSMPYNPMEGYCSSAYGPLRAFPRKGGPFDPYGEWDAAHRANVAKANDASDKDVDVVFLGDSITAEWGRLAAEVFQKYFSRTDGGKYEGLALGIHGDMSQNLLWRIRHGELPDNLHASVFWVLIGTNNVGWMRCSAEFVLMSIIRVVEEIRSVRPDATVVLNAILPRSFPYNSHGYVARADNKGTEKEIPILYDTIECINSELKRYARNREKVLWYETDLFFLDPKADKTSLRIDKKLMDDYLHPTKSGYELWAPEIISKLSQIIISDGDSPQATNDRHVDTLDEEL